MADDADTKSWWMSLPGLLTAVAAVLTAVGGLLVTFQQAGWIGGRHEGASPAGQGGAMPPRVGTEPPTGAGPGPSLAPRPLDLPDGALVDILDPVAGHFRYTITSATAEPASLGRQRVILKVRAWTDARAGLNFWSDSFRLDVAGSRLKPVNDLNLLVGRDETVDGEVVFEVDATAREAVLSVSVPLDIDRRERALRLRLL